MLTTVISTPAGNTLARFGGLFVVWGLVRSGAVSLVAKRTLGHLLGHPPSKHTTTRKRTTVKNQRLTLHTNAHKNITAGSRPVGHPNIT